MKAIIAKAIKAAIVLVCHMTLAAILIVGFHLIDLLIRVLGGAEGDLIFGILPLAYVFQLVDVLMIGLFGWMGLREAYEVLR